jgi:hypothetical protein
VHGEAVIVTIFGPGPVNKVKIIAECKQAEQSPIFADLGFDSDFSAAQIRVQ